MNAIPIRQQQQQQQNKLRQQQQQQQKNTQLGTKLESSLYATTASFPSYPSSSSTLPGRNKTISNGNSPWEVKRKRMFVHVTACMSLLRLYQACVCACERLYSLRLSVCKLSVSLEMQHLHRSGNDPPFHLRHFRSGDARAPV